MDSEEDANDYTYYHVRVDEEFKVRELFSFPSLPFKKLLH